MVCCVTLPKRLHLSEPLRCLIIKREESFVVDWGSGQNFKFGVGQTKILPLPLPSSHSVTSSHTISLSEFQLPPLPSGSETLYLLRDGVRQGDNTIIIVRSRAGGPAGPSCVGEFQGGCEGRHRDVFIGSWCQEAGDGIIRSRHLLWLIWEFVSLNIFSVWEKSLYWICYNVISVFYVLFFWPPGMWTLSSSDQGSNRPTSHMTDY